MTHMTAVPRATTSRPRPSTVRITRIFAPVDPTRQHLELESHCQLHRARTDDLIQRAETAARDAVGSEAGGQRARGLTEQSAAERVRWQPEADLIERVERFNSE